MSFFKTEHKYIYHA